MRPMSRLLVAALLLVLSRSAVGETIQLQCNHGLFWLPVQINSMITLRFILDSGASQVVIPADVALTLTRTGTVDASDYIGTETATLADGSTRSVKVIRLREVRVGGQVVSNVTAQVSPISGIPLLGQTFLSKLPAWTIDNARCALVLNEMPGSITGPQQSALPPQAPQAWPPTQPAAPAPRSLVTELLQRARLAYAGKDYSEAMRWLQMAAAQGSAPAQDGIGTLYENARGVPLDYAEAIRWYRMAADQGYAAAQNKIGVMYQRGWGVSQDYAEAMRWYQLAAAQRFAPAEVNIARMIARGWGVGKDCAIAKEWFDRAAAAGDEVARRNLRNGAEGACSW
jgi:clan AA aspartic protease (TIGR02281 family)